MVTRKNINFYENDIKRVERENEPKEMKLRFMKEKWNLWNEILMYVCEWECVQRRLLKHAAFQNRNSSTNKTRLWPTDYHYAYKTAYFFTVNKIETGQKQVLVIQREAQRLKVRFVSFRALISLWTNMLLHIRIKHKDSILSFFIRKYRLFLFSLRPVFRVYKLGAVIATVRGENW